MNKKIIIGSVLGIIIIILFINHRSKVNTTPTPAVATTTQASTNPQVASSSASSSSVPPLMQSTNQLFSKYKYKAQSYELFPLLSPNAKKALGAFTYTKTDLGNDMYKFTLVNKAEGYKGQSVTVSGDQFVYFVEPSKADDSVYEDSVTTDDVLIAVDAQDYILK
ncbi:MAG: hypothetical protein KGI58_00630 [Patescibacteria group bacterium]|nr:hypothetical protein [Patescibacteria group bacterium]